MNFAVFGERATSQVLLCMYSPERISTRTIILVRLRMDRRTVIRDFADVVQ